MTLSDETHNDSSHEETPENCQKILSAEAISMFDKELDWSEYSLQWYRKL